MTQDINDRLLGLLALNQTADLDMKPVMIRVITDLFTGKAHHSDEEIRQFEEICARLIDRVDEETLTIVARKLAQHAQTPPAILSKLIQGGGRPGQSAIELWSTIDRAQLLAAAGNGPADIAEAVARRGDLDADLIALLVKRTDANVGRALAENARVSLDADQRRILIQRGRGDEALAKALIARGVEAREATPLFLHADGALRGEILSAARAANQGRIGFIDDQPLSPALMDLERAALGRDWSRFAYWLSRCLSLPIADVRRAMADPSGETLALALAAAGVPSSMATRIFLCREPQISHSVAVVHSLAALIDSLTQDEARGLVDAIFGGAAQAGALRPARQHVAQHDQTAATTPSRPQQRQSAGAGHRVPDSGGAKLANDS